MAPIWIPMVGSLFLSAEAGELRAGSFPANPAFAGTSVAPTPVTNLRRSISDMRSPWLEVDLDGGLHDAICSERRGHGALSGRSGRCDSCVRRGEVRMICHVEGLQAQFHASGFPKGKCLFQSRIKIDQAGSVQNVASRVAIGESSWLRE